ncbi:MAG: ADP-ribosylglycohydrolase family protein [Opitutales bacterium]
MAQPQPASSATSAPDPLSRWIGAFWGFFIGDAHAMPVHWYYKRDRIPRDYGELLTYAAPKNPHPDSILWRSRYDSPGPKGDILREQATYWGKPGVHYHQFLEAGENTLNLQLARELFRFLADNGGYAVDGWIDRYTAFMLEPGRHRDTYVEECHRHFFANYGRGKDPRKCAAEDNHIGGLSFSLPIALYYADDLDTALEVQREHLSLTHKGEPVARAAELVTRVLHGLLTGDAMDAALFEDAGRSRFQALQFPLRRWAAHKEPMQVLGPEVSTACYLEDAVPATLYLALKFEDAFASGIIANTRCGGDNCHRGAVLGALLGAANGAEQVPAEWADGLTAAPDLEAIAEKILES